jgi:hypothetical protein
MHGQERIKRGGKLLFSTSLAYVIRSMRAILSLLFHDVEELDCEDKRRVRLDLACVAVAIGKSVRDVELPL